VFLADLEWVKGGQVGVRVGVWFLLVSSGRYTWIAVLTMVHVFGMGVWAWTTSSCDTL
jgi:hypothetical protein